MAKIKFADQDIKARTIRVHVPTYNHILEFFDRSPTSVTAAEIIRLIIFRVGTYCKAQMDAGEVANALHISEIDDIILDGLEKKEQRGQK